MTPETLTAAILFDQGRDLKIMDLKIPELEHGQVLVKIKFSGVCRSQVMERDGERGEDKWLPHLLGHEAVGIVEGVGPGVTKVKLGDKVIISWIKGGGIDAPGPTFYLDGLKINAGPATTFSNYSIVSENRISLKPEKMTDELGAFFGCAVPTGSGMVICQAKPSPSDKVIVLGAGGIGLSAILALKSIKVDDITVVEIDKKKIKLVREIGLRSVIDASDEPAYKKFIEDHSSSFDQCFECTGNASSIENGFGLVKYDTGQIYFATHPKFGSKISLDPHDLIRGKKIFGSWGGGVHTDRDIPALHKTLGRHGSVLQRIASSKYTLSQVNVAIDDLKFGRVHRPIIVMNHP